MPIKAVFLDAGGTLLRERAPRAAIYAEAARRRGLAVGEAAMAQWMYRVHRELPRTLGGAFRYSREWFAEFIDRIFGAGLGLAPGELAAVRAELFGRFEDPATFEVWPGGLELLDDLAAQGLVRGVVSNWSEALPCLLAGLGIAERIDFALVSATERVEKPDPELFQRALERAGVAPEEAVHLGDRPDLDVAPARAVGIRAVLFDPEGRHADVPVERVGTLDEFATWIRRRRKSG